MLGVFKGVYHVYPCDHSRNRIGIEELYFECLEKCLPSANLQRSDLSITLKDSNLPSYLLSLPEVEKYLESEKEFYFEVYSNITVDFVSFDTYSGTEHDVELDFPNYVIKKLDESAVPYFTGN